MIVQDEPQPLRVSIIIPSYGRPTVLAICLSGLAKLSRKDLGEIEPFEVLVVNNNPDSRLRAQTSAVCDAFRTLPIRELCYDTGLGAAGARNAAINKARGAILVFFDDDTVVLPGYFRRLMTFFDDPTVGGVGGAEHKGAISLPQRAWASLAKPGRITQFGIVSGLFFAGSKPAIQVQHLHGSNFALRSAVVQRIGLMDPEMEGHWRDETEFTYRVWRAGWQLIFDPKTGVLHDTDGPGGSVAPLERRRWAYWYNRNTVYLYAKHILPDNRTHPAVFILGLFAQNLLRALVLWNVHYLTTLIPAALEGWGRASGFSKVQLAGIEFDNVSNEELFERLRAFIKQGIPHYLCTPNAHHIVLTQQNPAFRTAISNADLVVSDGMLVLYAAAILGGPFKMLIGGRKLVEHSVRGRIIPEPRLFFVGGQSQVTLNRIVERINREFPSAAVVGSYWPPIAAKLDDETTGAIIEAINLAKPDFVFVGLGTPKQELWIADHFRELEAPVTIGVGAALDMFAGVIPYPPAWMTELGLEWLWRLVLEPRRLWRRYLLEAPRFFGLVLRDRIARP